MSMLSSPLSMAKKLLQKHEGLRLRPYIDTTGNETIGYGRNLKAEGISASEAEHLLANDIVNHYKALTDNLPWFKSLDDVRQLALLDMCFNLGIDGLLRFKNMLEAIEKQQWTRAAICALSSKWATQVHGRAVDISNMLQTGELPDDIS